MKINLEKEMKITQDLVASLAWQDKKTVAYFLAQTYYYVSHSVKLLALCVGKFGDLDSEHEKRFLEHIKEESNHELMALSDLKKMGVEIIDCEQFFETQNFWQTQYFYVQNRDPLAIMGYIIFLEQLAVVSGPAVIKAMNDNGLKSTFLKVHAEEDVDHIDKAIKLIESLSVERRDLVLDNMRHSISNYNAILYRLKGIRNDK